MFQVELFLFDTAGQECHDPIRPLCYPDTDVIIVCFAVDNPESFNHIHKKWKSEIRRHLPKVPVILVGTKTDVRDNKETGTKSECGEDFVQAEEATLMAKRIKAVGSVFLWKLFPKEAIS